VRSPGRACPVGTCGEGLSEGVDRRGDGFTLAEGVVLVLDRQRTVVAGRLQGVGEPRPEVDAVGVSGADGDVVPRARRPEAAGPGCDLPVPSSAAASALRRHLSAAGASFFVIASTRSATVPRMAFATSGPSSSPAGRSTVRVPSAVLTVRFSNGAHGMVPSAR